ncbi:MAG: nickel-dependent lactate racemase [Planctomycetes bacterium]|nr:nickel-dependent lactate racemase [Planctomycetota bacterium]
MRVSLAYGADRLSVELPGDVTTVIEPTPAAPLADERAAVVAALRAPIGRPPLRDVVRGARSVCIAFTDATRATPNERIIPWLLDEIAAAGVPRDRVVLLNQLGTHRPSPREELERLLTAEVVRDYRVVNHDSTDVGALVQFGTTRDGTPALLHRLLADADVRIVTGFIEPHLFAGFSGGPKGIMPGGAGLATVISNHGAHNIGDPRATFGVTDGNPVWEEIRDIALRVGPSFLLNVALDERRRITGVFAGDLIDAHRAGLEFVRGTAMQRVAAPFDVVVTTNSGAPLDLNLYQGVKGIAAGARIVRDGGTVILACECREGVPSGSPFERLMTECSGPGEVLARLATPGFVRPEQWQAQILSLVLGRARVLVRSTIPDHSLRAMHLDPCPDIAAAVRAEVARIGPSARVAVLPQGPLTVPYVAVS